MNASLDLDADTFNLFVSDWEPAPGRLPDDVSAWAIGDIHGHLGHLEALLAAVETLIAVAPPGPRHLIALGDSIDRGPDSIGALTRLARLKIPGVTVTRLWGNHEEFLDRFLHDETMDETFLDFWMVNGGLATLANLGISQADIRQCGARRVIEHVRATAPPAVTRALAGLTLSFRLGSYLFVHAGVHPRAPLDDEDVQKLTTMRQPFLAGDGWKHDFAVVHGHSIVGPDIAAHRVSVDSGAYHTGVLTCVELRGDAARFICATQADSLDALLKVRGRRPLSSETWRAMRLTDPTPGPDRITRRFRA